MSKVKQFGIEVDDVSEYSEKEQEFFSQAHQDLFVLGIHSYKNTGTFIDIGCGPPREHSNTFLLEKNGWTGLSFDIQDYKHLWDKHRTTPFIHCDATQIDYKTLFNKTFNTKTINYLSLDIDTASNIVLEKLPFNEYTFNVITIEHDLYAGQSVHRQKGYTKQAIDNTDPLYIKQQQHKILTKYGYICLVDNISVFEKTGIFPFEDWWVSLDVYKNLKNISKFANVHSDEVLNRLGYLCNRDILNTDIEKVSPENLLKSLASDFINDDKPYISLTKKPKLIYIPSKWLNIFSAKILPKIDYNFSVISFQDDETIDITNIVSNLKLDFLYLINGKVTEHPKIKTPPYKAVINKLLNKS